MGKRDFFEFGSWNVRCDKCGIKYKNHEVRRAYDGLTLCLETCWYPQHPQEFVRAIPERDRPAFTRPNVAIDVTAEQGAVTFTIPGTDGETATIAKPDKNTFRTG